MELVEHVLNIYIRHYNTLCCYDIRGEKQKLYAADEDSSYVCVELRDNENSPLYVHVLL